MPAPLSTATIELPAGLLESARRQLGCSLLGHRTDDGIARLQVAYWDLPYLAHWILGWGPRVTVAAPDELRAEVAALAEATREHHAGKSEPAELLLT